MTSHRIRCASIAVQALRALPFLLLAVTAASAQNWIGTTGSYTDSTQWSPASAPNSSTASVFITNGTLSNPSTANLNNSSVSVGTLTLGQYDTLNVNLDSTYTVYSGITGDGNVNVFGGNGANTYLQLGSPSVAFTSSGGPLTITLDSGNFNGEAWVQQQNSNETLSVGSNVTVQGTGTIGNGGLAVANAGTISAGTAAASGGSLTLNGSGGIANTGVLSAVNSATLQISTTVNNSGGGNINASGGTVDLNATIQGGTLNGTTLQSDGGSAMLDGSTQGALTLSSGSVYTSGGDNNTSVTGTIVNNGNIQINGGNGTNTYLNLTGSTTLQGTGTVTLNSGDNNGQAWIQQNASGLTLTNEETIQGYGVIGNGGLAVTNQGTINANSNAQVLMLNGGGGVQNTGAFLDATGGGILQISTTVNNSGGSINANGGTVDLNATVQGGTLNGTTLQSDGGNAALDGSTQGALTLSSGSVYTSGGGNNTSVTGTIVNNGNIQINGGDGTNTYLNLTGSTTLQGTGTVTLNSGDNDGQAWIQQNASNVTLTNEETIQGYGVIGNGGLAVTNQGTINANSNAQVLTLNGGGGVQNTGGFLDATGGGILQISTTVNNSGGSINANGGTVDLNATIQGGTLNGTTLQSDGGSATLDGSSQGALTLSSGSVYTSGGGNNTSVTGTIVNNGNIQINGGDGTNTYLNLTGSTTLQGTGTVTLNSGDNDGQAWIQQSASNVTLTNEETIQGYGVIGNGGLAVTNQGTINANSGAGVLTLNGGGGVLNTGGLDATSGGILQISTTVNNSGGSINANGGTVKISSTIEGGTLNGTTLQANGTATLDGASEGQLTLSSGSAFTSAYSNNTNVTGTIVNNGNIQINGGDGTNTYLDLNGNTTLQGTGTVTLNSGNNNGQAWMQQNASNLTLTNEETIQGYGVIGNGGLTVVNGSTGTLAGNAGGNTLLDNASGGTTNNGTFLAANGGTLRVTSALTNFSGVTLTGGAYTVDGTTSGPASVMQLSLGVNTGGEIVNNNARITLNGPNAGTLLEDINGNNALTNLTGNGVLASNQLAASLTVEGGYNLQTASVLTNLGTVTIGGSGSEVEVGPGGTGFYTQLSGYTDVQSGGTLDAGLVGVSGGQLQVDGTVDPASIDVIGPGILEGTGTIDGNVFVGSPTPPGGTDGTTILGDSLTDPGTLTVDGDFTQYSDGTLDDSIGSLGFGDLQVNGDVNLGGDVNITDLGGFDPAYDEIFNLIGATGGLTGSLTVEGYDAADWTVLEFTPTSQIPGADFADWDGIPQGDPYLVALQFIGNQPPPPPPPGVPEPSAWMDLVFMVALVVFAPVLRRSRLLA